MLDKNIRNKISFDDTVIEELLEKAYWIVDILPKQVPKNSAGQYAAVEQYYLQGPQRSMLRRKYLTIFLKLNCYYDLAVSTDCGEYWSENPEPQKMGEWLLSDVGVRTLHVMIPTRNTMMVLDHDDTYMTVYNPAVELLQMLQTLAGAEGLFMWKKAASS